MVLEDAILMRRKGGVELVSFTESGTISIRPINSGRLRHEAQHRPVSHHPHGQLAPPR